MAEGAMTAFLSDIGLFFTEVVSWGTEIVTTVTSSAPLTIMVFGFAIVGFGVGIYNRIVRG